MVLYEQVRNNLRYPKDAHDNNIEGKVFVNFSIDEEGNVDDVEILKGIGYGCDMEAKRVVQELPKWKPGEKNGKVVKTNLVLPITFKL